MYSVSLNKFICWWVCPIAVGSLHLWEIQGTRTIWEIYKWWYDVQWLYNIIQYELWVRSFGMIRIRISYPRSLGSSLIKWTDESILDKDSSVHFIYHDPNDLGSYQTNAPFDNLNSQLTWTKSDFPWIWPYFSVIFTQLTRTRISRIHH